MTEAQKELVARGRKLALKVRASKDTDTLIRLVCEVENLQGRIERLDDDLAHKQKMLDNLLEARSQR